MEKREKNEKPKKRGHVLGTVLLILLILILLVPVAVYGYLALCGFHPAAMRANCDPEAPYSGERTYAADGSVTVVLTESDLYRLADAQDAEALLSEYLPPFLSVRAWSIALRDGGFDAYADGRVLGFVPVPVKAAADASFEKGTLTVKLREVWLGKWLSVPMEKLIALGLPETIELELNDGTEGAKIRQIAFAGRGISITDTVLDTMVPGLFEAARPVAQTFAVYALPMPDDSELLRQAGDFTVDELPNAEILRLLSEAEDPADTLLSLIAMYFDPMALSKLSTLEPFETEFIAPYSKETIAARRAELMETLGNRQYAYEALLTAVRDKYKAGGLTLDVSYLLDNGTGGQLLLAPLAPELALDEAGSRILLLHSLDALHACNTADMPLLADVPKTSPKATGGAYDRIPYDLGLLTMLPCGVPAVLFYEANGTFTISCIETEQYSDLLAARLQPYVLTDGLPKPPRRSLVDAPNGLVSPYDLLIPYEVIQERIALMP